MSHDDSYPLKQTTKRINGAAIEVHRRLGPGYLESIYEDALAIEFEERGIDFECQKSVDIRYRDQNVGEHRLDFLVEQSVILELKAVSDVQAIHRAQLMSYLEATEHTVGLLINFNVPVLKDGIRRIVQTDES